MWLITLYLTTAVYIFQDPNQLTLLNCFSELVSDEELADITSFDEDNKPIPSSSHGSSSEDHKDDFDNFNARRKTQTTKSLASVQTMDDDPDFSVPHQAIAGSKPLHIDTLKSVQQSKGTTGNQTSRSSKIVSTNSGGGNQDKTSSQKQTVKHKSSTSASRLANYLLQQQHVDITPVEESGHCEDQVAQSTCIDRDTYTGGEPSKPRDNVDSLEWFGFDHEEDLDSFEHFDDEADFCDSVRDT